MIQLRIAMAISDYYTDKQIEVYSDYLKDGIQSDTKKIFIQSGAVRTGKTVVDNDLFLRDLLHARKLADRDKVRQPLYILAGYSDATITTNVLNPIENKYGIHLKFDSHNAFTLFGVKIVKKYTNNERAVGAVRGFTAYGAYINEASLCVENVWNEINNRVSIDGAHIIADTNPDSPTHYLKAKWIDRANDPDLRLVCHRFVLDDNIKFLGQNYIKQLKASYASGAFYDRAILGEWASGQGAVYQDWYDKENYVDRKNIPEIVKYWAGVDWGYKHYGSIVVIGKGIDNKFYLVDEYSRQFKNIDFWKNIAHELEEKYGQGMNFICDTANPDKVTDFMNDDLNAVNADKRVEKGIEWVATLIKNRRFLVVKDVLNKKDHGYPVSIFDDNIHNYVWDEKTGAVVKLHDDCLDAIRYVLLFVKDDDKMYDFKDVWGQL